MASLLPIKPYYLLLLVIETVFGQPLVIKGRDLDRMGQVLSLKIRS